MAGKLRNASRRIPATPPPSDQPPPPMGDNGLAGIEEAQMLSALAKIRLQKIETAKAKAVFDGEKAKETELFRLAKAAGFERGELEDMIADAGKDGHELDEAEERRTRLRGYAGLPAGHARNLTKEMDMDREPRDAAWWESEGYRSAIRGAEAKAPEHCPPEFHQSFLQGWHNGSSRTAWAEEQVALTKPAFEAREPVVAPPAREDEQEAEPI